jgi:hypothetical protein
MTKKILGLILIVVLLSGLCGLVSAESIPVLPTLKLTVEQLPAFCWPPLMGYTAQLSFVPPVISNLLKADFYNIDPNDTTNAMKYIGSAPFDNTGKAFLAKQMPLGKYVGIARTVINGSVIWSNRVEYVVR